MQYSQDKAAKTECIITIYLSLQSQLEFRLRVQEFVQYIKANQAIEAVEYSRKQLSKFDQDEMQQTLRQMMLLLMFNENLRGKHQFYNAGAISSNHCSTSLTRKGGRS